MTVSIRGMVLVLSRGKIFFFIYCSMVLQSGWDIDKFGINVQFLRTMAHYFTNTPYFGTVVSAGYHVEFSFHALNVNRVGGLACDVQIKAFFQSLQRLMRGAPGYDRAACVFFFSKGKDAQGRPVHKGNSFNRFVNGYRRRKSSLIAYFFSVIPAKGLQVFKAQQCRQSRVVPKFWVLIQRKMNGVQADVMVQEKPYSPEVITHKPQRIAPKKPVVDKKHPRSARGGPLECFQTGIHGKGCLVYLTAVVIDLYSVQGIIKAFKAFDIQYFPKESVQICRIQIDTHSFSIKNIKE
jgi:hypothetical protein